MIAYSNNNNYIFHIQNNMIAGKISFSSSIYRIISPQIKYFFIFYATDIISQQIKFNNATDIIVQQIKFNIATDIILQQIKFLFIDDPAC